MSLTAVVKKGVLTIAGDAARSVGLINVDTDQPRVQDNGVVPVDVAIDSDDSLVKVVDAREVEAGGVYMMLGGSIKTARGSQQGDYIEGVLTSGSKLYGYGGDDLLVGGRGTDSLDGGMGADRLQGREGDDLLKGGKGDDLIDGGIGDDTAVFSGNRDDYAITVEDGVYVVTDLRARGGDGVDRLGNIEHLQFQDVVQDLINQSSQLEVGVKNGVLTIAGDAARSVGLINVDTDQPRVQDNGVVPVDVAIDSDDSLVKVVDAREVEAGGVYMMLGGSVKTARGSQQGDYIEGVLTSGSKLYGYGGDDLLVGGRGTDSLDGGMGADRLQGREGDDLLKGGKGDDLIDGGIGDDTAVFSGNFSGYAISVDDGVIVVTDLRSKGGDGVDRLGNIEHLKFQDGVYDIGDLSSQLEADVTDGVLTISGDAARSVGLINVDADQPRVQDNGVVPVDVAIDSDDSLVKVVDAREVEAGGVYMMLGSGVETARGSQQGDYIEGVLTSGSKLYGYGGDDLLVGGRGTDSLDGGMGADRLQGREGDDTLMGGQGDDLIDGGKGMDTAVYSGNLGDYAITIEEGIFVISDLRTAYGEGIDRFENVEFFQFKDQTVDFSDLLSTNSDWLIS